MRELYEANWTEATAVSVEGYVDAWILETLPWEFHPAAIEVPVLVWHGEGDVLVPSSRAATIAAASPGAPRSGARIVDTSEPPMSPPRRTRLTCVATIFTTVDDYITSFPPDVQKILCEIRRTMHAAVPGADETISYNIPTLTLNGHSLVYFAGWARHVSLYPIPDGDDDYETELAPYRSGASTAKFVLAKPIPFDLIARITKLLAKQHDVPEP